MQLPVLFRHEMESGLVSRTKEYEIKLHHLLVDVEDDVNAFIDHGWQFVTEGERAIERFAELTDAKKPAPAEPTPIVDAPAIAPVPPAPDAPDATQTKAATSKGKSAAK